MEKDEVQRLVVFPQWAKALPQLPCRNGELKPATVGSGTYRGDYAAWDSDYGVFYEYGNYTLTVPTADSDGNGCPDILQLDKAVNTTLTGTARSDWRIDGYTLSYTASGPFRRAAGSDTGTYSLTLSYGSQSLTAVGTLRLAHWTGTVSYTLGNSNVGITMSLVQPNGSLKTLTGTSSYTINSNNQITFAACVLLDNLNRSYSVGTFTMQRSGNRYRGNVTLVDGNKESSWGDYRDSWVEITDTNDINGNGIPDLSDSLPMLSPTSRTHGSGAETGNVNVYAGTGYSWTATSSVGWITITSGSAGTGNGTVNYSVASNAGNCDSRVGTLNIAGKTFTVTQAAGGGSYSISPTSRLHGIGVETGSLTVTTGAGCNWSASTGADWIHTSSTGVGSGTANYSVDSNTANCVGRTGTVSIAGQVFTVMQAAGMGSYFITPMSRTHTAVSGSGSVTVTAGQGCTWTASSNAGWLTVSGGNSGNGNGTVNYSLQSNPDGSERSGTLLIAGQTFTVTQASNVAPQVNILPAAPVALPNAASLSASVTDDGAPNGTVSLAWSKISGPGAVSFGNSSMANTTASFSTNGTYTLQCVASDGVFSTTATIVLVVTYPPIIITPPGVTNSVGSLNGTTLVLPGVTNVFSLGAIDPEGNPLSCLWIFGDGSTSTDCNPSHVFTNCGPVEVTASVSDGLVTTSTGFVVSVACPFTELPKPTKLQLKSNFVPGKVDQASLKATFELPPPPFSRTNVWATVDIGGVSLDFWINEKGIGTNGLNKVTLKTNAKTGLATLSVKLKGDFESAWAGHGLTNATVVSQPVTVPVLLMFNSDPVESFYVNKALLYKATAGKAGQAK